MHHFVTEMCTRVCTFLLQNGALWDVCLMHCGICEMGLWWALSYKHDIRLSLASTLRFLFSSPLRHWFQVQCIALIFLLHDIIYYDFQTYCSVTEYNAVEWKPCYNFLCYWSQLIHYNVFYIDLCRGSHKTHGIAIPPLSVVMMQNFVINSDDKVYIIKTLRF